jgi:hypothetical protein
MHLLTKLRPREGAVTNKKVYLKGLSIRKYKVGWLSLGQVLVKSWSSSG